MEASPYPAMLERTGSSEATSDFAHPTGLVLTTLDPIKLTEYAIVLSAAALALPLTYLPVLIVANDATLWSAETGS